LKLKSLNKRMVEENKNILKSEEEISVKYLEMSKNFEKLMEEKMAGKIDSETVKELREENKKLKKNEVELRGKLEKLQKANDVPKGVFFHFITQKIVTISNLAKFCNFVFNFILSKSSQKIRN